MSKGGFSAPSPPPKIVHPPVLLRVFGVLLPFRPESWLARVSHPTRLVENRRY